MSYHNRSGKGFVYVILNAINTNDTRSYSYPLVLKYYTVTFALAPSSLVVPYLNMEITFVQKKQNRETMF